jgi:hypothetical protein
MAPLQIIALLLAVIALAWMPRFALATCRWSEQLGIALCSASSLRRAYALGWKVLLALAVAVSVLSLIARGVRDDSLIAVICIAACAFGMRLESTTAQGRR